MSAHETPSSPAPGNGGEHPTPRRSNYQVLHHIYDWMSRQFGQAERHQQLYDLAHEIKDRTVAHLQDRRRELYVAAAAPGLGKSHAYAEICDEMATSVIVPRHELIHSVAGYARQRHIQPATEENCSLWYNHHYVGSQGYNTRAVHQRHDCPCAYMLQFEETGSAIFQIAHSMTEYIARQDAIIIEEFNLPDWMNERCFTVEALAGAAHHFDVESPASIFLVSWQATLTDFAQRGPGAYQGKEVLDTLNHHIERNGYRGGLSPLLGVLRKNEDATNPHPWPATIDGDLPPVTLPHIYQAVFAELATWERGNQWNSCLRITVSIRSRATLHITTTRKVNTLGVDGTRGIALADATANREILERWYEGRVIIDRPQADPPPHMRHVHLPLRASKTSLISARNSTRDLERLIRKLRFFLREYDRDGSKLREGKVGLITYQGCEETIRTALQLPEGNTNHFWNARGSNTLEQCEILLLVGTPTLSPETIYRLARALYRRDPNPLIEESHHDGHRWVYDDARIDNLACYLTSAELTQCAHRHRPLRYDGRITISICESDIDYLPTTHNIVRMPRVNDEGEDESERKAREDRAKLDQARRLFEAQGIALAVHRLARAAHVATDTAARYLREWRAAAQQQQHTHTPVFSSSVPDHPDEDTICNMGYVAEAEETAPSPTCPGTATAPPITYRGCSRCGCVDDWIRDPVGQIWLCSCFYWWGDHPEWREGGRPRSNAG
jgi:hypothetical protein